MANSRFFEALGLTGSFCTRPRALISNEAVLQLNAIGSTDFNLYVQISLDQVNWVTVPETELTNLNSADSPFVFQCIKGRYVRICGQVNSGALDIEAYIR